MNKLAIDLTEKIFNVPRDRTWGPTVTAIIDAALSEQARSCIPQDRAGECLALLDAAGLGHTEHGNTLTGMVHEACNLLSEQAATIADLNRYQKGYHDGEESMRSELSGKIAEQAATIKRLEAVRDGS